jgi:hypothetical protein
MSAKNTQSAEVPQEEHRNDLIDTAVGFAVTFGFFFLLATIATIITLPPVQEFLAGLF